MGSVLLFGFLIGLRHALEADHLAAVATMARGEGSVRSTVLRGAAWGVGHTVTLLALGGLCVALGAAVPSGLARLFEAAVGAMLVGLGLEVLVRLKRRRVHIHTHRHADGVVHLHAHAHAEDDGRKKTDAHEHPHPPKFPRRALAVGLVHGFAGSAALVLVTLEAVGGLWLGLAYIALFGLGSIFGMATLSVVIAVPFRASGRVLSGLVNGLEGTVGASTVALGVWVLIRQLWAI